MKKILILFGGHSYEHDISVRSCKTIIDNIDKEKYAVSLCGIIIINQIMTDLRRVMLPSNMCIQTAAKTALYAVSSRIAGLSAVNRLKTGSP